MNSEQKPDYAESARQLGEILDGAVARHRREESETQSSHALSGGRRLQRGFSRIGVALGMLIGVGTLLGVVGSASDGAGDNDAKFTRYACLLRAANDNPIPSFYELGIIAKTRGGHCPYYRYSSMLEDWHEPSPKEGRVIIEWAQIGTAVRMGDTIIKPTSIWEWSTGWGLAIGVGLTAGLAAGVSIWGLFCSLGWVFAGFTRD